MTRAQAPGKVILAGEHAVVYGRPAIAVPVWEAVATAEVRNGAAGAGCVIYALDLGKTIRLADAPHDDPLALVARLALRRAGLADDPDWRIDIASDLPIAGGLGSGAAVSAVLVRAILLHAGMEPAPELVSELTYAGEEVHHGTPSGIDNTVVAYGQPVWFVRGEPPAIFACAAPFRIAIADSGATGPTRAMVDQVRARRAADPARYDRWFDEIGEIVQAARQALEAGQPVELGPLFDRNQALLAQIGVSTPALERLMAAARAAGAGGAKLSGAGGGGNIIALVEDEAVGPVRAALLAAGAKRVLVTTVAA